MHATNKHEQKKKNYNCEKNLRKRPKKMICPFFVP